MKRFNLNLGLLFARKMTSSESTAPDPSSPSAAAESAPHTHSVSQSPGHEAAEAEVGHADTHSHDHSSDHGFGIRGTRAQVAAGYRLTEVCDANATAAGSDADGLLDPSLGIGYLYPFHYSLFARVSLSGTLPASNESRELGKISTVTPGVSLTFKDRRFTYVTSFSLAFSNYNYAEEVPAPVTTAKAVNMKPGHDGPEGAAAEHDREELRGTAGVSGNYKWNRQVNLGMSADLSRTQWEKDDPTWLSSFTLGRISYQVDEFAAQIGLGLQSEDHFFKIPSDALIRIGLNTGF